MEGKRFVKKNFNNRFEQTKKYNFEVIVVDNNSGDGSVEMVEKDFPEVELIASKDNLGFAKGNNLGLKKASGDYILFLNPDVEVLEEALDKCLDYMKANKEIDNFRVQAFILRQYLARKL